MLLLPVSQPQIIVAAGFLGCFGRDGFKRGDGVVDLAFPQISPSQEEMSLDLLRLQLEQGLVFLDGLVKGPGLEKHLPKSQMRFKRIRGKLDGLDEGTL